MRYQLQATATLTVTPPVDHLELEPAEASIELGESQPYKAFAVDKAGNRLGEVTDRTGFTISPSEDCAKASCTPTRVGGHTVTGRLTLGRRTVEGSAILRVIDPVVSLALKPVEAEIPVGTPQPYTAEGTTAAGRTVDVTDQTGFTITGPGPGECPKDQLGKVSCTASKVGDHTVTATLTQKRSRRPHRHGHPARSAPAYDLDNDDYERHRDERHRDERHRDEHYEWNNYEQ